REECAGISTEITMTKKQLASEEEKTNPYTDEYKTTKEEFDGLVVDEKPLYALKEKSEHYKILIKMLTDNKSFVRRRLLDQYVPYLNQKIDSYCVRLGLPHKIEISNDLSVNIEYMQRGMSYGLLSKGERGRLNFSTSMAFRDLLSMSGFQYNILCIDELLDDGMDTSGFHDIFKVLEESNVENLFLISHRDDLVTQVDNIINVVKENGFTIIE
ncbi:MAG: hypothetical protein KJO69_09210, partial [Gammaproteobacteria bacterium]|nr:hypothetical protein [Gammaproteobacteria bacterium]